MYLLLGFVLGIHTSSFGMVPGSVSRLAATALDDPHLATSADPAEQHGFTLAL